MRIIGLEIPFLDIEGKSAKQIWYAEQLREAYIRSHEDRFREIDEAMQREVDAWMIDDAVFCESFLEDYTEEEKACLFATDAGGIIATLRRK